MDEEQQENPDGSVEMNAEQINVTPEMELEKNWISGLVFIQVKPIKLWVKQTTNIKKKKSQDVFKSWSDPK